MGCSSDIISSYKVVLVTEILWSDLKMLSLRAVMNVNRVVCVTKLVVFQMN